MAKKSLQLGRAVEWPDSPEKAQLDRVPNPQADTNYVVRFTAPEFTSLCPVTGQPDFAHLVIDYVPGQWLLESKSLKLYVASFRNHGAFHEDCTVMIGKRIADRDQAEIAAHRRLLVSARRHPDRRVLADRQDCRRACGFPTRASRPIAGGGDRSGRFEPDGRCDRPPHMRNVTSITSRLIAPLCLIAAISNASAAPPAKTAEDRYISARDAAIEKISAIYDAGNRDDAARKAEDAASADLEAQMRAILNEPAREGFGPAKLNIDTFSKGDEGFGTLDGLRFDAMLGKNGKTAGRNGADGKYVEPKAHIIVTTQTLFERWLRAHKDWWGKDIKNVPQQIGSALKDESFYMQAISSGSAVVNFNSLPIAKPIAASFAYAMLAGRTQSDIPDAADNVFVSAIANGKVYIAYGSIDPKVEVPACLAIRTGYNKKAEQPGDDLRSGKIDRKAYDKLGDLRQKSEDAYKRCFTKNAPKQPSFTEAIRQAERLLSAALNTR